MSQGLSLVLVPFLPCWWLQRGHLVYTTCYAAAARGWALTPVGSVAVGDTLPVVVYVPAYGVWRAADHPRLCLCGGGG